MRAASSVVSGETGSIPVEDRRAGQQPIDVDKARTTVARQRNACRMLPRSGRFLSMLGQRPELRHWSMM
jgi:hypothetical protein